MNRTALGCGVLALLAACGGTVIEGGGGGGATDAPVASGMEGAGGQGTTTASLTGSPTGTGVGTGTGTGDAGGGSTTDACASVCMTAAACASIPDCVSACENVPTNCVAEHQAWLSCLVHNHFGSVGVCAEVSACHSATTDYYKCNGWSSGYTDGSGGQCQGFIEGPLHELRWTCSATSAGSFACACVVDGVGIGKCEGPVDTTAAACFLEQSCCTPLFLVDH
jgi:hypothetical protein